MVWEAEGGAHLDSEGSRPPAAGVRHRRCCRGHAFVLASSLLISACASLTNPHVTWERIEPHGSQAQLESAAERLEALRRQDLISEEQYKAQRTKLETQAVALVTEGPSDALLSDLEKFQTAGLLTEGERDAEKQAILRVGLRQREKVSFARARQYAQGGREAYLNALGDQARLQSWLGIGLIPLSAAAVGLGASGATSNAVLALGLTGAAAYGTSTWLINRPRQRAYVAGYNALTCAVQALEPFGFSTWQDIHLERDLILLDSAEQLTSRHADRVEIAAGRVRRLTLRLHSTERAATRALALDPQLALATTQVQRARTALTNGRTASRAGRSLQVEVINAGQNLTLAVDKVDGEVQRLVVETQRDVSELLTIINGLGSVYSKVTRVPQELAPTVPEEEAADAQSGTPVKSEAERGQLQTELDAAHTKLEDELELLLRHLAQLETATRRVVDTVHAVHSQTPQANLQQCGVDDSVFVREVGIEPAGPFELKLRGEGGASVAFQITGGLRPFSARLPASRPAGLSIEQTPGPFARGVVVAATGEVPAGTYSVVVSDGSGERSASAEVRVVKEEPTPAAAPPASAPAREGAAALQRDKAAKRLVALDKFELKGWQFDIVGAKANTDKRIIEVELAVLSRATDGTPVSIDEIIDVLQSRGLAPVGVSRSALVLNKPDALRRALATESPRNEATVDDLKKLRGSLGQEPRELRVPDETVFQIDGVELDESALTLTVTLSLKNAGPTDFVTLESIRAALLARDETKKLKNLNIKLKDEALLEAKLPRTEPTEAQLDAFAAFYEARDKDVPFRLDELKFAVLGVKADKPGSRVVVDWHVLDSPLTDAMTVDQLAEFLVRSATGVEGVKPRDITFENPEELAKKLRPQP